MDNLYSNIKQRRIIQKITKNTLSIIEIIRRGIDSVKFLMNNIQFILICVKLLR